MNEQEAKKLSQGQTVMVECEVVRTSGDDVVVRLVPQSCAVHIPPSRVHLPIAASGETKKWEGVRVWKCAVDDKRGTRWIEVHDTVYPLEGDRIYSSFTSTNFYRVSCAELHGPERLEVLERFVKAGGKLPDEPGKDAVEENSEWVKCPICGESDMEKTTDRDGNVLIDCVNHNCASNGGDNADAFEKRLKTDDARQLIRFLDRYVDARLAKRESDARDGGNRGS